MSNILDGLDLPTDQRMDLGGRNQYPFLQWIEPDPNTRSQDPFAKVGGFFMPEDQFPDGLEVDPAHLTQVTMASGVVKYGLGFRLLYAAPLAFRLDWQARHKDGTSLGFAADYNKASEFCVERDDQVRGRSRFLVLVRNIADGVAKQNGEVLDGFYGPFILTVYGAKGKYMQQAFQDHEARLLRPWEKTTGKALPPYICYVPLKASEQAVPASKNPSYRTVIVPPVLAYGKERTLDVEKVAETLFVGERVLKYAASLWDDAQEWATAPLAGQFGEPNTRAQQADEGRSASGAPFRSGPSAAGRGRAPAARDEWQDDGGADAPDW